LHSTVDFVWQNIWIFVQYKQKKHFLWLLKIQSGTQQLPLPIRFKCTRLSLYAYYRICVTIHHMYHKNNRINVLKTNTICILLWHWTIEPDYSEIKKTKALKLLVNKNIANSYLEIDWNDRDRKIQSFASKLCLTFRSNEYQQMICHFLSNRILFTYIYSLLYQCWIFKNNHFKRVEFSMH